MKAIVILTLLFSGVMSRSIHQEMMDLIKDKPAKDQFKIWHYATNQKYDLNTELGIAKYKIFKKNLKFITETNAKGLSYTLTLTKFADISQEEFESTYLTRDPKPEFSEEELAMLEPVNTKKEISFDEMADNDDYLGDDNDNDDDDDNIDYSKYDYRSFYDYSKDQLTCGSCWAFATTHLIEYFAHAASNKKVILSPQELVDCSENSGCKGGHFLKTLLWIQTKGIVKEVDYPYKAEEGKCDYKNKKAYATTKGVFYCDNGFSTRHINRDCSTKDIKKFIKRGPYATAIDGKNGFQFLGDGIWTQNCFEINHAVVVTHIDFKQEFVSMVNSWGNTFGVNGHGKIAFKNSIKGCGTFRSAYQPEKTLIVA